jgi:hypothetical protein
MGSYRHYVRPGERIETVCTGVELRGGQKGYLNRAHNRGISLPGLEAVRSDRIFI